MDKAWSHIQEPAELQAYTAEELTRLAGELRQEIIDTVAVTGGHLASNLGVVELTLSLAKVFDFSLGKDRLIFDVGHQVYTWKLITGRAGAFSSLRQAGGLSGFPKREESPFDFYNAGHSSTAISIALGYLRADRAQGKTGHTIAVVGDGALTGGMAFEALNDLGQHGDPLKIILNDNQMSIDHNVGSLEKHLEKIRISRRYRGLKRKVARQLEQMPKTGNTFSHWMQGIKGKLRRQLHAESVLFENLGLRYYGPVDGHNIPELIDYLEAVKACDKPVILHVVTKKGQGYRPAESAPSHFHGVAPFEVDSGQAKTQSRGQTFSQCVADQLVAIGREHNNVFAITAAMAQGTGLAPFAQAYPERFYDTGIAEQHATSLAAGLSLGGARVFLALYSTFSQRAVDQILHDICLEDLPVCILMDRAGLVGSDGETHQGLYDTAIFSGCPHLELYAPADAQDLKDLMQYALSCQHPIMIRYPKAPAPPAFNFHNRQLRGARQLHEGYDYTLVVYGSLLSEAEKAWKILSDQGIRGSLLSLITGNNIQINGIINALQKNQNLIIVEDGISGDGFATNLICRLKEHNCDFNVKVLAVRNPLRGQASRNELLHAESLDGQGMADSIKLFLQSEDAN